LKVIYVAGKYRGKCENEVYENIQHARRAARKLWQQGWCVICPHLNSEFMGGVDTDKMFLEGGLELLRRSDAIFMLLGFDTSEGAKAELAEAKRLGVPVIYEENE
jgi:dienelactone hydrolase